MKALKILFYTIVILLGLLIGAAFIIAKFYGEDIKNYVVQELNKNLKTKVDVKKIDFTVIESFPYASIQFTNVAIYSSINEADTMLSASNLACKFNLIDLYNEKYELLEIEINSGKCNLLVDEDGNENYIFWKSSDSSSTNFNVNLEQVNISEMNFSYQDIGNKFLTHFYIDNASLQGSLSENITQLKLKTQLNKAHIKSDQFVVLNDRTVFINAEGNINQEEGNLNLNNTNIGLGAVDFILYGDINYKTDTKLDLAISSKNSDLAKAISILPKSIGEQLKDFNISGQATIDGSINGVASSIQNPSYVFNFAIKDGYFKKKNTDLVFNQSNLNGSINNGTENTVESTEITIENFNTKLNESDISGKLVLKNPAKPYYSFDGNLNFDLADAIELLEIKDIQKPSGSIQSNLSLKGRLEQFEKYSLSDFKKSVVRGEVKLFEIGLEIPTKKLSVKDANGSVWLENSNVELDQLNLELNQNIINLNGSLYNLIPYAMAEDEKLITDLVLTGKTIDINNFLSEPEGTNKKEAFSFPKNLTLYLETKFDELVYDGLVFEQLNGDLAIKANQLSYRNLEFYSQGGFIAGDYIFRKKNDDFALYCQSRLNKIEIEKVFKSFNDFGQKTIKAENISGKTSADVNVSILFDKYLNNKLASLKIDADVILENGELNNVKAMEALSDFVELDELRSIKFKTLRNQLSVKDCTLTIPKFNIESTAMNLSVSGNHKFNNELDYHFVILLNEILGKKVKKPQNNEFGYLEDDGLGRTKIFMKMYGTTQKPQFGNDTEVLKTHLKTEIDKEKKTIKSLLNQEFGLFKNDSTIKSKQPIPTKKSPFQIEWEEGKKEEQNSEESKPKKKSTKKGKFGKFIDKIAQPNEEEFVEPIEK